MKKKYIPILIIFSLLLFGVGLAIAFSTPASTVALAEVVEEVPVTEEQIETTDSIKEAAKEIYNTQIAPLFAGASLTSIASVILSVINSKVAKKATNAAKEQINVVSTNVTTKAENLMHWATQLQLEVKTQNTLTKETLEKFMKTAEELKADTEAVVILGQKQEKTNQLVSSIANVLLKLCSTSKEVINSGLGEEITKMAQQLKELTK